MAKKQQPDVEVIERVDPEEESSIDGDPAYEFMLDPESVPSDVNAVWVRHHADHNLDDVTAYMGLRYRQAYGKDGIKLLSGVEFADDEMIRSRDHVLMIRDREYHEKRVKAERKTNRELRAKMLSKKKIEGETYVGRESGPHRMREL